MTRMHVKGIAASIVAAAAVVAAGSAIAADHAADQFTCRDVMRESGSNREIAIAFLHGYVLGKTNATAFNLETLAKQTDDFIDHCLDNPGEKALDAMMKVKG